MRFDVVSVIPSVFEPYMSESIMGRASDKGLFDLVVHDLRTWTHDRHRTVDDKPFGGGQGMLMKPEPVFEALAEIKENASTSPHTIFFSPVGRTFTQRDAERLACLDHIVFVCGRYEGFDERVYALADEVISLGDWVMTGAELAALTVMDSVVRLLPGALGDDLSAVDESFSTSALLEYEQYTRPAEFHGMFAPEVLLSGNHQEIARWRRHNALERTLRLRPDLLTHAALEPEDRDFLAAIQEEHVATTLSSWSSVHVSTADHDNNDGGVYGIIREEK